MRQRKFTPPTRVVPQDVAIKTEPVDLMDEERPVTAEQGEEDIKPTTEEMERGIMEGKRKRSQTPEGREMKPAIPGSKDMPIEVDEVDEVDVIDNDQERGTMARIPQRPRADGRPVIIRNVVYKVYNVINGAVQSDAPHPPPFAPPPGLQAVPQAPPVPQSPPAAVEELDEDFVPMNYVAPALPQPIRDPEPEIPTLSKSQQEILETVLSGKSVLIHGSAGTGKSVLIRAIKKAFEERYEADNPLEPRRDPIDAGMLCNIARMQMSAKDRVAQPLPEKKWKLRVTASTGMAAV